MFCPQCGQERLSTETSFCSRCGFLLTGAADLLQTGGLIPHFGQVNPYVKPSPRSKGIRKGLFLFLLSFLIVPLLAVLAISIRMQTPILPILGAILLVVGGLLRAAYALMFESPVPGAATAEESAINAAQNLLNRKNTAQLPPQQSYPVSSYDPPAQGNWRNTSELEPHSITDHTTKHLEANKQAQ